MLYNINPMNANFILISVISLILMISPLKSFKVEQQPFQLPPTTIAQQLASNINNIHYSMKTAQGFNMDCLKVIIRQDKSRLGVFHSSKGQTDNYNSLYAAYQGTENDRFTMLGRLSSRGSQGTIFTDPMLKGGYLIAYELENHEHGNTFALRYYENYDRLFFNNFLYEYQLVQQIDGKTVRNIGTPSIDFIQLDANQTDPRFNQYTVKVKFHYSPDGSHDLPGYGTINLKPLRDFVDKTGKWIGGCKQNYGDWRGTSDINVLNAMRKIGVYGKIGQRDMFSVQVSGKTYRYYLYQANLNADFDWKYWRIFLYGQTQNQVVPIPFVLDKVVDLANPHITIESKNGYEIVFQMSFFLPSEGMQPQSSATPGQVMVKSKITL